MLCLSEHKPKTRAQKEADAAAKGDAVDDSQRITAREVYKPQPWVVSVGYRYQHMSNAHLSEPNPGQNQHMLSVSYRF